ncbi:MAG: ABC transporter permease [Actinobacteria bacterium]|nr:ABC transporter permease [Actinomycetota bacterium]
MTTSTKKKGNVRVLTRISSIALFFILFAFIFAKFVSPYDPTELAVAPPFSSPSWAHFFGTDELGRDSFSRSLYGGRITVLISILAATVALFLGTIWGFAAGIFKGWLDEVLMRTADAMMAIPALLFALVCISGLGASFVSLTLVAGILLSPSTARMARSALLVEISTDYFTAGIASGLSRWKLIWNEVMPNVASQLLVQFSINAASAVMLEAALSFIGLGVQPPSASLGTLILQGYAKIYNSYWYVLFPSLLVVLIILLFNAIAENMRISMESDKSSS